MKILIFFTYNRSFLASFFYDLALNLSEGNNEVKIISIKEKPEIINVSAQLSIQILKKGNKWQDYISIYNVIRTEKPGVIISNFSYVNPAILSGRLLGIKKNIIWFHTLSAQLNPARRQIFIKSFFLKYASEIIVNSQYLKQDLEKNYSLSRAKIFAIPFWSSLEGSRLNRINSKRSAILKMGCPGRIEEVKNQGAVIDALRNLDYNLSWKLYFAGSGSDEKRLKSAITSHNWKSEVEFLGVLSLYEMKQFYQEMDLIILPSKFEAFGLVLIEALSMGCPVLVSKNFGALTYIDDEEFLSKYSFDPNDANDLKNKLNQMVCQPPDTADYFRNIYTAYFQKKKILAQVVEVINL